MFEDYMRNLLGMENIRNNYMYPGYNRYNYNFGGEYNYPNNGNMNPRNNEINELYPEIYKIVYPMVKKACINNTKPIGKKLVDDLTREIYGNIETGNIVNVNVNVDSNNNSNNEENGNTSENSNNENYINRPLFDLIKILILRELR